MQGFGEKAREKNITWKTYVDGRISTRILKKQTRKAHTRLIRFKIETSDRLL
jgi:hypothetical protein